MKKPFLIAMPLLLAGYAGAQIFGPTIVFDPTAAGKIIAETAQVVRVVTAAQNTYTQLQMDARFLTNKNVFRGSILQNVNSYLASTPTTDQWAVTALSGLGAANAYGAAAVSIKANPAMIALGSPFAAHYATAQIGIASGKQGLQAVGNANVFANQMAQPIQNCENSALQTGSADNTTPALLGTQAACTALALKQNQASLQVESARLQLELVQAKALSDNYTDYANMATGFDQTVAGTAMMPGNMAHTIATYPDR